MSEGKQYLRDVRHFFGPGIEGLFGPVEIDLVHGCHTLGMLLTEARDIIIEYRSIPYE